jgi:rRNA maturation endonuclease Nob1
MKSLQCGTCGEQKSSPYPAAICPSCGHLMKEVQAPKPAKKREVTDGD